MCARNDCFFWCGSGGKGVGCSCGNDVECGFWECSFACDFFNDAVQCGIVFFVCRLGSVHVEDDFVAKEVHDEVGKKCKDECDRDACLPADKSTD